MKSFLGTLKIEWSHHRARCRWNAATADFLRTEALYNQHRLAQHSALSVLKAMSGFVINVQIFLS